MELVVIKELLGHAHIGVTATVYAHVRLQRQALDTLGRILDAQQHDQQSPDDTAPLDDDHGDDSPLSGILVR